MALGSFMIFSLFLAKLIWLKVFSVFFNFLLLTILSKLILLFSDSLNTGVLFKVQSSEKASKFCEIFTLLLFAVNTVKIKMKISQNFEAFSEYVTFTMTRAFGFQNLVGTSLQDGHNLHSLVGIDGCANLVRTSPMSPCPHAHRHVWLPIT